MRLNLGLVYAVGACIAFWAIVIYVLSSIT
jgi:hypothetical protein